MVEVFVSGRVKVIVVFCLIFDWIVSLLLCSLIRDWVIVSLSFEFWWVLVNWFLICMNGWVRCLMLCWEMLILVFEILNLSWLLCGCVLRVIVLLFGVNLIVLVSKLRRICFSVCLLVWM